MKQQYAIRYSASAHDDLLRLFDFLLDRSRTADDFHMAQEAIDVIQDSAERRLGDAPFLYRKAGDDPFLRELLIPFRAGGYVAFYEIDDARRVTMLAVRHQREDDYH